MSRAFDGHARHFERLYARDTDPWRYASSPEEALKRRAIADALGPGKRGRGLELGCSNGVSTLSLAHRFSRLLSIDAAPRAVALAKAAVRDLPWVAVEQRAAPEELPHCRVDAIIASEILYYLPYPSLYETLRKLRRSLLPGGVLVTCHAAGQFEDADVSPRALNAALFRSFGQPVAEKRRAQWDLKVFRGPAVARGVDGKASRKINARRPGRQARRRTVPRSGVARAGDA